MTSTPISTVGFSVFFTFSFPAYCYCICNRHALAAAYFPETEASAEAAVEKLQAEMGENLNFVDSYVAALKARVDSMKTADKDLFLAAQHTFQALWPEETVPASPEDLAAWLNTSDDRLQAWRESAARAGSDEAMTFVMSHYEDIDLDVLATVRVIGAYVTEPELIERRQRTAYGFVQVLQAEAVSCRPLRRGQRRRRRCRR